jgi:hypothetical protein
MRSWLQSRNSGSVGERRKSAAAHLRKGSDIDLGVLREGLHQSGDLPAAAPPVELPLFGKPGQNSGPQARILPPAAAESACPARVGGKFLWEPLETPLPHSAGMLMKRRFTRWRDRFPSAASWSGWSRRCREREPQPGEREEPA